MGVSLRRVGAVGTYGLSVVLGFLFVAIVLSSLHVGNSAKADGSNIVINEIMYNPASKADNDEFLELFNPTGSTVDLSGWCFTQGIVLCFSNGISLAANSYGVISPSSSTTLTTYGVATLGTYTGKLSNSGEVVTLVDGVSAVVDSVTYSDSVPWPTTPDGSGPSLELRSPQSDHNNASSWAASSPVPTPGAINSITLSTDPAISDVSKPTGIAPGAVATVTAKASDATTVTLDYKVNFDTDQTAPMYDDGAHADGPSGDGVYGGEIPSQAAGSLVRYKVAAVGPGGSVVKPGNDESIHYYGYTVANSTVTTSLPVLQWFMEDSQYTDLVTNHVGDEQQFPSVIAYGDTVFDNTAVRVKGEYSLSFPKKSFKFELPQGYTLTIPGYADHPVGQFHLNGDWIDTSGALTTTAWWAAQQAGLNTPQIFKVRAQRNGQFQGLFTFAQKYDKDWREANNYQSGAFYEDYSEKKTRLDEDSSDINQWVATTQGPKSASKRTYLLDNADIPSIINVSVFEAMVKSHDWSLYSNMIQYRDTENSGRWSLLPWDLDIIMAETLNNNATLTTPYDVPDYINPAERAFATSVYDEADMRKMYFRRMRTMADKLYGDDQFLHHFQAEAQRVRSDAELDFAKWGSMFGATVSQDTAAHVRAINKAKEEFFVRFAAPWAVPPAQASQLVSIDSVGGSADTAEQYIKLKNTSGEYIDISGWYIDGADYRIPSGTIVPAGGSVMFLKKDQAYRAIHGGGIFVGGQFGANLQTLGSHVLRLKDSLGSTIDTFSY